MAKASYVWSGSGWVAVASAFPQANQRSIITTPAGSYTLSEQDTDKAIIFTSNTSVTLTIPLESSYTFANGTSFEIIQKGLGTITFASSATLHYRAGYATFGQNSTAYLRKIGTDEWILSGDLD